MKYYFIQGAPNCIYLNRSQFLDKKLVDRLTELFGVELGRVWVSSYVSDPTVTLAEPLYVSNLGVMVSAIVLTNDVETGVCYMDMGVRTVSPADNRTSIEVQPVFSKLSAFSRTGSISDKAPGWIHLIHASRTKTGGVAKFKEIRPWLRKPTEAPTPKEVTDVVNQPWARFANTAEKIDSTPKQSFFDQSKVTTALDALKRDVAKANFRGESYILYFKPTALSYDDEIALKRQMPFSWRLTTDVDNGRPITYLHFE